MGKHREESHESHEKRKWQKRIEHKQSQTEAVRHQLKKVRPNAAHPQANMNMHVPVSVQVRHELHKVREKARDVADNQKFAVQRTIAGFHQQQNSSSQELEKCQALRVVKDRELSSLRNELVVQQQRATEQRAELEAGFEATLAPMRAGVPALHRTPASRSLSFARALSLSRSLCRARSLARSLARSRSLCPPCSRSLSASQAPALP